MTGAPVPSSIGMKLELCRLGQQACGGEPGVSPAGWSPSDPWEVWEPSSVSFPGTALEKGRPVSSRGHVELT